MIKNGAVDDLKKKFSQNEELYQSKIILDISKFKEFAAEPFICKYGINDDRRKKLTMYFYGGELLHFVEWTVSRGEGFREDKVRFVMQKIKEYLITGQNQSLYVHQNGMRAYWSPRSFKDTNDVIEQFFSWWCVLTD